MPKVDLQNFVKYGKLFEIYGKLLSVDRQKIMSAYFDFNMTLVEIAKEKNISRQAVLDAIDKSCQKLEELDSVLKLNEKFDMFEKELNNILADKGCTEGIKSKVEKLLKEM